MRILDILYSEAAGGYNHQGGVLSSCVSIIFYHISAVDVHCHFLFMTHWSANNNKDGRRDSTRRTETSAPRETSSPMLEI